MENFIYHNPVKVIFGKGTVASVADHIPKHRKIMMTYGGGSIRKNGVYDEVKGALHDCSVIEYGGIEANPQYDTLIRAALLAREEKVDFLLSVGGGSVLDGTKFIAAAVHYHGEDPWDILAKGEPVKKALPIGAILTLPATGSEMNGYSVVSRSSLREKRAFGSPLLYPQFSILDPETTYSLSERQTINGIVDPFVHVTEQYLTEREHAPLQDRQAEAILLTLIEEAPKVKANPDCYETRANIMWCATQALNGVIGCGVPQDWATHMIGHELTAYYGLDHAQTLAIVLPALLRNQREAKRKKLIQYAERVWGIHEGSDDERIERGIEATRDFFVRIGMKATLGEYGIGSADFAEIACRFEARGMNLGEKGQIGRKEILEILNLCL